jgi:hypothetical protein
MEVAGRDRAPQRKESHLTIRKSGSGFWESRRRYAPCDAGFESRLYAGLPAHSATSLAEKRIFPIARSPGWKERTMRIPHIFAATGLVVAAMTFSTSAEAQRWHGDRGHDRGWHDDRGWHGDRGWRGRGGYWHSPRWRGRGGYWHSPRWRHAGYGWRSPRCWTEWRWHHRVRVCR